jgi:hypothetical protein
MKRKLLNDLKADIQAVLKQQPGLRLRFKGDMPYQIWGTYSIYDDQGAWQASFEIQVAIPVNYPHGFPKLVETSQKIERIMDRHIDKKGLICEEIDQAENIIATRGITIKEYFDQYVHKYLCWQLIYDEEGKSYLQEWSHQGDGVFQFYRERLNCDQLTVIQRCLRALVYNQLPGRNDPCLCGGPKKAKYCHGPTLNELKGVGRGQLVNDLKVIQTLIAKAA